MIEARLDNELIDDVALMEALLNAADLPAEVVRSLDTESGDRLPLILYDLDGSDDSGLVNGPGLWDVVLRVWVWGESDEQVWQVARAVHREVTGWDTPGKGYVPGFAGVERASTVQKFRDVWDTQTPTRLLRESNAQYALRVRVM